MNKECLKSVVKNVDTHLFEIVNNLICSICQELFNKPVTTPCGHSFCNGCIKRVLSSKNNSGCPLCKNPVKRYGLEADEVKSKFGEICKELPNAFEEDVKELTRDILDFGEDLIKCSKLSQLCNQDCDKEPKTSRKKTQSKRKAKKGVEAVQSENETESFCPVLKRGKNVLEYASAKKKRMEDLVSISQTEPASNSSLCEPVDAIKKLNKIEKVPPEEKINEWFDAVGDNIYINSPSLSILETNGKNESDNEKKDENTPTMIRRDYNKSGVSHKNETATTISLKDPYEFVPSQNNRSRSRTGPRKRQKRSTGKRIPDFKALQSFSKESLKRNSILSDMTGEEVCPEQEVEDPPTGNLITASQKFDQLLLETKEEAKKTHVLYSASQSSSPRFLDVSLRSKVDSGGEGERNGGENERPGSEEGILFKNMETLTGRKGRRGSVRSKRRRSSEAVKGGKKKKVCEGTNEEGESVEECLEGGKMDFPPNRLKELLKELMDDDVIYETRPLNGPMRLPEILSPQKPRANVTVTQNTELIGFCTQEECPNEKNFKKVVEELERELNSNEFIVVEQKPEEGCRSPVEDAQKVGETFVSADENGNCNAEIWKACYVEFLHLGKLTPIRRRAKSTVVKVVFPIGLASLARRHVLQTSYCSPDQVVRKQPRQVSTGIQTTQEQSVSCLVQTTQVEHSTATIQTTQVVKPSVEIQTTQKCSASAEVQTSQRLVCQEIQTTQIGYESAQVQTTQSDLAEMVRTPQKKPSHQHRKLIRRKKSRDADSLAENEELPAEKEVLMDFDAEEEFKETWRNTQKHDQFVEFKNQKNKEKNLKQARRMSADSDDSDVQPPRRRNSLRILSEESVGIMEKYETRQLIPLDVKKVDRKEEKEEEEEEEEEMEVIQLDTTPKTQTSEEQMLKVLKNIDLDLSKGKSAPRNEKSEESDSDFFVEQTPPRPASRLIEDARNLSRSRMSFTQKQFDDKSDNLDGVDVIGDSLPKGFSESFRLFSNPPKPPSEKHTKDEVQKTNLKIEPNLPDENDQNRINAFEGREKTAQLKAVVDAWRLTDAPPPTKPPPQKKLCILASSVKSPDMIARFASRFKGEYLSKPTKDMTHLIVGLHENEDGEVLPLCTPKLLFAMANKKWVVSELWVDSCLKAGKVLPEDSFEVLDPVGGHGCKKARISTEKLLRNVEVFLFGEFHMISKEEFADLIVDCGGTLVSAPERFSYLPSKLRMIIADRDCLKLTEKQLQDLHQKHSTVILSRDVIIMSIQGYELVNFSSYLLHPASEESLVRLGYPQALVRNEEEEGEEAEEENSLGSAR